MGILLIRLSDLPRKERLKLAVETIGEHINKLKNIINAHPLLGLFYIRKYYKHGNN